MKILSFRLVVLVLLITAASLWSGSHAVTAGQGTRENTDPGRTDQQATLMVQLGHSSRDVTSVAYSRDGQYIVTGSNDKTAALWEAETGREIRRLTGHSDLVTSVAYSPDGKHVLTGSWDQTARVWDVATGEEVRRLEGHANAVQSVAYSPDGKQILTGSWDKTSRIWDAETGKEIRKLEGHSDAVYSVAYSPDGLKVLTGGHDKTARIWEVETGNEIQSFVHERNLESVAYAPDGKQILTGSWDHKARIWDVETGRVVRTLEGHSNQVNAVTYSPDGKQVVTGSLDKMVLLWDAKTGKEKRKLWGHFAAGGAVLTITFSFDGKQIVTGGTDGRALVWSLDLEQQVGKLEGSSSGISAIAYSPDGRNVLTASYDLKTRIWDLETGREIKSFTGHTSWITSVAYSPFGKKVVTGSFDNTARVWDVETGKEVLKLEGHLDRVSSVTYSPDGKYVLTGSADKTARLWDAETGKAIHQFKGHSDGISSVAYSPDGRHILTGSADKTARLWEVESERETKKFELDSSSLGGIDSVAFSPDGKYALTGSYEVAQLWELGTGKEARRFDSPAEIVKSVAFSPDGKYLLTGNYSKAARIWDVTSGKEVRRLEGHSDLIDSVAYSPDGRHVLTGSYDSTVRIWEASTGGESCKLVSFRDGNWVVIDPEGRFDTNNLEEIKGLYWIVADEPMRPLPLEIFMRDYYEPRLLPRILNGDQFEKVRDISGLNRVQPKVTIKSIAPQKDNSDLVTVTVEVGSASGNFRSGTGLRTRHTDVYDVRLFRNGRTGSHVTLNRQLVGQIPQPSESPVTDADELQAWRKLSQVGLDPHGKQIIKFENIRLPRADVSEVEFSAYAFNEDRVKTPTNRKKFLITKFTADLGRAYIISVGVNTFDNQAWNLQFAANDARLTQRVLYDQLSKQQFRYESVVQVPLISDAQANENSATKANFKAVLELLAGKKVDPQRIAEIPNAAKVQQARPEDLVIISFSSHGFADSGGNFYLFPSDIGNDQLKQRLISSQELSNWLKDVDAGEMVMIVDACHAAAAVGGGQFKPGPMGSRGLGQLAYDKGMRILTATQAANFAIEEGSLGHGLLTFALVKEGLEGRAADFKPRDQTINLNEWLEYGVLRVPALYDDIANGKLKTINRATVEGVESKSSYQQQPSLFDFAKKEKDPMLVRLF